MDSVDTQRLGYLLRWLRQRDGLSQKAMSKRIGCSQAQVDKLENGKTDKAGVLWIEQVCGEFEIPWGYFAEPGQAQLDPAAYMREHAGAGGWRSGGPRSARSRQARHASAQAGERSGNDQAHAVPAIAGLKGHRAVLHVERARSAGGRDRASADGHVALGVAVLGGTSGPDGRARQVRPARPRREWILSEDLAVAEDEHRAREVGDGSVSDVHLGIEDGRRGEANGVRVVDATARLDVARCLQHGGLSGLLRGCVARSAVGACGIDHRVASVLQGAAYARGSVGDDAPNPARFHPGGIG